MIWGRSRQIGLSLCYGFFEVGSGRADTSTSGVILVRADDRRNSHADTLFVDHWSLSTTFFGVSMRYSVMQSEACGGASLSREHLPPTVVALYQPIL